MKDVENPMVIDRIWNRGDAITDDDFLDVIGDDLEEIVRCCICGEENYKEEANYSEIWEDTYLCGNRECHNVHYQGWSEKVELQKYYIKRKSIPRAKEYSFKGI